MATHVDVKPEMIEWAIKRSQLAENALKTPILQLARQWVNGNELPTLPKLDEFSKKVRVPFGYLFLDTPPDEPLPIADFRTFDDQTPRNPSPNLLDTISDMQLRQNWMREEMIANEMEPIAFVNSVGKTETIVAATAHIRNSLGLLENWTKDCKDEEDCFAQLRHAADQLGILIFLNGIVGVNPHRPLNCQEFRGFVLSDEYAPLIFVNGNDTKAARLFTLTHELVHLALGKSGLFNLHKFDISQDELEYRCNKIAAEVLVPSVIFERAWHNCPSDMPFAETIVKLARNFRVSRLVIARLALDRQLISRKLFLAFYKESKTEWEYLKAKKKAEGKSGGDYYNTTRNRLSRRFSEAVFAAVRAGELLHRDAYNLTGLTGKTFEQYRKVLLENKNE
jgi:Zn-dependent peptidase ImmA (M78 family)